MDEKYSLLTKLGFTDDYLKMLDNEDDYFNPATLDVNSALPNVFEDIAGDTLTVEKSDLLFKTSFIFKGGNR
jgi:hypothetical protein